MRREDHRHGKRLGALFFLIAIGAVPALLVGGARRAQAQPMMMGGGGPGGMPDLRVMNGKPLPALS